MSDLRKLLDIVQENSQDNEPQIGDIVEIEMGDTLLETYIEDITEDGVIIKVDETAVKLMIDAKKQINESLRTENPCWKGYHPVGTKKKNGRTVPNCVPGKADESIEMDEAEYQGRNVPLNKPMAGDVKKSKVYVKKPNGKVVKVNFGDKNMRIKKSNPNRRKSFRARHHCENPGPKWKARYWSCRAW